MMPSAGAAPRWLAAAWLLLVAAGATGSAADELRFVRVNVSADALQDLPLDGGRYLPMPLVEFDDLVARLGAAARNVRLPVAAEARYRLTVDAAGGVTGGLEFELVGRDDSVPAQVSLGRVVVERCVVRTAEGTGEAAVYCLPDGSVAIRTTGPATYDCELRLPGLPVERLLRLPLIPALTTTVELQLPRSLRPFVIGTAAAVVEPVAGEPNAWRIVHGPVGAGRALTVVLSDGRDEPPLVRSWNAVTIRGRQAEVVARLEPLAAWTLQPLPLDLPAEMRVTRAVSATDGRELGGAAAARLEIPERLVGSREPLLVTGMMPLDLATAAVVPTIRPAAARWGGGNAVVTVDPTLAIQRVQLSQCLAIARETGETWPVAAVAALPTSAGIEPARLFLEYQSPAAEAALTIGRREASFDVARVTTIDISPGTVLGRAAIDLQVVAGEVFETTAEVAPGWFIDSVEAVDWRRGGESGGGLAIPGWTPEWRVVRSPRGSELRIGLPVAAMPQRSPGLRITGHRAGLPLGAEFSSDDMDMLRFPGETAMLEFQVGPTAVLEAVGGELGVEPLPDLMTPLSGLTAPRARIRAGERAPAVRARLVRRRPPVEADVTIDLLARDDRLAETFRFTCRPVAGELDAVIIHFSEPVGPDLEWSLANGATGTLAAQLLDPADATRGELRSEPAVAESWLVELRPATTAAVTFRGSRTVPLETGVPVTLAWVEAAERPGGTVTLRSEAGWLPELTNRQLRELPPAVDTEQGVLEFSYGSPAMLDAAAAVATIAPAPATAAPRAWAWKQSTTCWCHDSGLLEWETSFEIENQGRETATLTLPPGLRVEGVTVAGEAVAAAPTGPGVAGLAVPLPRASSRLQLFVRGSGGEPGRLGWWRIGGVTCGIDIPVLDRETTLMLPPGVVLASAAGDRPPANWADRLFGVPGRTTVSEGTMDRGFTPVEIPGSAAGEQGLVLVRRRFVVSLTVITAGLVAAAGWLLVRRHGPAAVALCGTAALAAVWFPVPWDLVARGAFWAAVVGTWAGSSRGSNGGSRRLTLGVIIALGMGSTPGLADEPPLRVYVTDEAGAGTALVPERLLRRLATAASGPPGVRVLASEIMADVDRGTWQVRLDLDADRGGELVLDQGAEAAVWRLPPETPRGVTVTMSDDGRRARIQASTAGRHRLALGLLPAWTRSGDIATATVRLPPAPRARIRTEPAADAAVETRLACDRAVGVGPWLPAAALGNGEWELASADRVRLVRPADRQSARLTAPRTAVSFNDIAWHDDGCRLTATFDVGGEGVIVRSLIVRAARGLEPIVAAGRGSVARPLGDDRFLIEISEPRAGQQRVVTVFRMPLAEPVGVFEAPFVWLESAETDVRTVRLRPAADLEAEVELPAGIALVRPREEDGPDTTAVWRSDAVNPAAETAASGGRIIVRRRLEPPGVVQDLAVEFADDHVGLRLRCRLDAAAEPLLEIPLELPPAAIVDRVSLVRDPAADRGAADRDGGGDDLPQGDAAAGDLPAAEAIDRSELQRVDLVWSRESADRIVAVVQRPDTGRFELQLEARLPIRPASRGRLPIVRLALAEIPVSVSWRAAAGMSLEVTPAAAGDGPVAERMELGPAVSGPGYVLSRRARGGATDEEPKQPTDAAAADLPGGPFTVVNLAIDDRGRAWGLVRFDLVTRQPLVTLALPAGLRLFDVRADGREVAATPGDGNTWEVRLHDVGWPRSLVAVFAGVVGSRLSEGQAIRLEPPRLLGLPAGRVVWSLDTPQQFSIRVSEPARVLEPAAFVAMNEAERTRFDEALRLAVRQAGGSLRERLDGFLATRHAAGGSAGERSWYEAFAADADGLRQRTLIAPAADGTVTVRAVRGAGTAAAGRGLATAVLLLLGLAGWTAVRRYPDHCRAAAVVARRWWWVVCGGVWLLVSQAILPGGLILLVGIWLAWPRRQSADPVANDDVGVVGGTDSTMTLVSR